jgi:hypothetical protein
MRRAILSLAAAAVALSIAGPVFGYCRTTTVPIPAGYDPTQTGCIFDGTPLVWPSMPVTYQLEQEASSQTTLADATAIVDKSFAKWAAVECSAVDPQQHPNLSFRNAGPTDAGYAGCEGGPCGFSAKDAPHVIVFRDQGWPYSDPANTLALTTVTYGVETGHIFAADTEINSAPGHVLSNTTPPPIGAYSLEAIVTHEAGHFIGLAHSQDATAVMFAFYQPDAVALAADDTAGVCAAYPPPGPSKGCECAAVGREGSTTGVAATELALCVALARRRRRPTRDVACRPARP